MVYLVKRILLVDDAVFMRMILRRIAEDAGYEVVGEASNGKEAIQKYSELKPDLVTMDITMPEMNGIEATKEILNIDKDARIIMVSAMGQHSMVTDAMEAGARDFIVKPFNRDNVMEKIEEHVS